MIKRTAIFHYRTNKEGTYTRESTQWTTRGGVTVAFVPVEGTDIVRIGVARCTGSDNFSKQLGRTRSIGRSKASNAIQVTNDRSLMEFGALGLKIAESGYTNPDHISVIL